MWFPCAITFDLLTQSRDLPFTQESGHGQSIHDATTTWLVLFEGLVAASRTYLTPVSVQQGIYNEREPKYTVQQGFDPYPDHRYFVHGRERSISSDRHLVPNLRWGHDWTHLLNVLCSERSPRWYHRSESKAMSQWSELEKIRPMHFPRVNEFIGEMGRNTITSNTKFSDQQKDWSGDDHDNNCKTKFYYLFQVGCHHRNFSQKNLSRSHLWLMIAAWNLSATMLFEQGNLFQVDW